MSEMRKPDYIAARIPIDRLPGFWIKRLNVYYFNLMAEKYLADKVPSAARLAAARLYNKYNVEISELDKTTAERIKMLCFEHDLHSEIETDSTDGQCKILIARANLPLIEKIEEILRDSEK